MATKSAPMKIKSVPLNEGDIMYIERIMKSTGMSFSGSVRHCISTSRGQALEDDRHTQLMKKIDGLVPQLAGIFEDGDS